jgi:hypothetical protein
LSGLPSIVVLSGTEPITVVVVVSEVVHFFFLSLDLAISHVLHRSTNLTSHGRVNRLCSIRIFDLLQDNTTIKAL